MWPSFWALQVFLVVDGAPSWRRLLLATCRPDGSVADTMVHVDVVLDDARLAGDVGRAPLFPLSSLLSHLSSLSSDCHLGSPGVAPLLLVSHRHLGSPGVAFDSSSTTHTCLQTLDGHLGLPGVASALGDRRQHLPSCSVHLLELVQERRLGLPGVATTTASTGAAGQKAPVPRSVVVDEIWLKSKRVPRNRVTLLSRLFG